MYEYQAAVLDVLDGDSVRLDADLGFSIRSKMTVRLYGINTPEVVGEEKPAGLVSKARLSELILGKSVLIKTFKDKGDKYGRILADIFLPGDPVSVNQKLLNEGLAKPYFGTGVKPV
jgi:micrococcal nuclease